MMGAGVAQAVGTQDFEVIVPARKDMELSEGSLLSISIRLPADVAKLLNARARHASVPDVLQHSCPVTLHLENTKTGVLYEVEPSWSCSIAQSLVGRQLSMRVRLTFRPIDVVADTNAMGVVPGSYFVRAAISREWLEAFPKYALTVARSQSSFKIKPTPKRPPAFALSRLKTKTMRAGETIDVRWIAFGLPNTATVSLNLFKAGTGTRHKDDYVCNVGVVEPDGRLTTVWARQGTMQWRIPRIGDSVHGLTDITHCIEFGDESGDFQIEATVEVGSKSIKQATEVFHVDKSSE